MESRNICELLVELVLHVFRLLDAFINDSTLLLLLKGWPANASEMKNKELENIRKKNLRK